jgi:hypothetical protein
VQELIEPNTTNQIISFSLREITEMLIKHQKLHEGFYDLSFEFQISVGGFGASPETVLPGAMFGISRIGLSKSDKVNINSVDASKVNPAKSNRQK